MDHRRALRAVQHDQLEKSPGAISAENQESSWIFTNFVHDQRMAQNVLNVLSLDIVPERRREDLHPGIVLRNCCAHRSMIETSSLRVTAL